MADTDPAGAERAPDLIGTTNRASAERTLGLIDTVLRDMNQPEDVRNANAQILALQAATQALLAIDDTLRHLGGEGSRYMPR